MKPKNKLYDISTTVAAYALLVLIVSIAVGVIYILSVSPNPETPTTLKHIGAPPFVW
jgi:hypothetical protein